ncbi:hypothetical protein D9757_012592 [Collybiopsis confluens]|uniref:Major facilitator superfamily (MFS) profile domain-containing protein n=1 Tax=Collybiopsis confluens TaxID=2823264 RepID=A0A8H5CZ76_9AGAR|nr:hypothetical protein D9757_012592 [Collybiopsis confluens]
MTSPSEKKVDSKVVSTTGVETISPNNSQTSVVAPGNEPTKNPAVPPPPEFPEGGLAGWSTVIGAFLIQFCGFGVLWSIPRWPMNNFCLNYASNAYLPAYYTTTFITNESTSTVAWIGGVNASFAIFTGLISGRLFDKGYFYHMVLGGAIVDIICLWLLTLAKPDNFYQNFLAQGVGCGIASGMFYLPSIAVVSHYFRRRRALAMTIVASGSSMGSVLQPIMLNNLLNSHGWKTATVANAALITGVLVVACSLMRTRLPPPTTLMPFTTAIKKFSRDGAYVVGCLGLIIFSIGYYYPLFFIQLDAELHGVSKNVTFYVLVILNVFSFVGRLSPGFLANKIGVPYLITMGMFGCSVVMFGLIGAKSVGSFIVIAILYGYSAGTFISLANPFLAGFATDQVEVGARMGIGFTLSGIGALVGAVISHPDNTPAAEILFSVTVGGAIEGALLGPSFVWWKPAVFSGIFCLAGVALMIVMLIMLRLRDRKKVRATAAEHEKA